MPAIRRLDLACLFVIGYSFSFPNVELFCDRVVEIFRWQSSCNENPNDQMTKVVVSYVNEFMIAFNSMIFQQKDYDYSIQTFQTVCELIHRLSNNHARLNDHIMLYFIFCQ